MKRIRNFLIFTFLFFSFILTGCHRETFPFGKASWDKYTYPEYDGFLYVTHKGNTLYGVICANYAGLQGSFKLTHQCSADQVEDVKKNLERIGLEHIDITENVDRSDYPDLSAYLTFIMSHDELHELWCELGLEKDEE